MLRLIRRYRRRRHEDRLRRTLEQSGLFDRSFYLMANRDVAASGQDPILHFIRNGAAEGRSPSATFNLPVYLDDNPGARTSGLNPVVDWLEIGVAGGRRPPVKVAEPLGDVTGHDMAQAELARVRAEAVSTGLFSESYYLTAFPDIRRAGVDPLEHYLLWGHGENRNPSSAFDTHYYRTQHGAELAQAGNPCPLVHYLDHGRRAGYLTRPPGSVTLAPSAAAPCTLRLAVHVHMFYPEMMERFAALLRDVGFGFDLFVSTCGEANTTFVRNVTARLLPGRKVIVRDVPNRGRDIAPFLLAFPEIWCSYDAVLHLHSKKSPHAGFGTQWLDWILRHLLSDRDIALACVHQLEERPDVAMLFADNYFEIKRHAGWNANEDRARAVLARLGAPLRDIPRYAHFAAGSIGWFRVDAFAALASSLTLDDFEVEDGQIEGTLAHVLERAMPLLAVSQGRALSTFYVPNPPSLPPVDVTHASPSGSERVGLRWMRDTPAIARHRPKPLKPGPMLHDPDALEISWIIPDFGLGAGGHMTIFRFVELLDAFGHRQTIWIQNPRNFADPAAALAFIRRHYRDVGDKVAVRFLPDDVRQLSGHAVIATDCWTVFPAAEATNFQERFYFIQDYEPYFHPVGENSLIAESTYKMGFAALCAGDWLLQKAQAHGMWARKWELASDPEFYFPAGRVTKKKPQAITQIAFYCRSYTPRRAVNLGFVAFEELAKRRKGFEVLMFGEAPHDRTHDFPHRQLGILAPRQLGELYRGADLGIVFSTTNYSLVPLEMMACELPVIEIDVDSTRAIFPTGSVSLAAPDPVSIADAIERMLDNEAERASQAAEGLRFVDGLDWGASARTVEAALRERLGEVGSRPIDPDALAAPAIGGRRKASVIIPTFNGGEVFRDVLRRVLDQTCGFAYDVLVVDSSSTDGTAEFVRELGGRARLHVLDKSEFQHGRTRNLAISLTDGEFVAVLTQDATPADDRWLAKIVGGFELGPRIAGVIGRHRAYPRHNPFVARDLDRMFDRLADLGPIFNLDRGLPRFLPRGTIDWQMTMHFYSDNNSAMRRSVWRELPYPEVEWGEDQIWAWQALKLGFSKGYVDDAVVYHSHDFPAAQQVRVATSEGRLFSEHFGYVLHEKGLSDEEFRHLEHQKRVEATQLGISQVAVSSYLALQRATIEGRMIGANTTRAE